MMTEEKIKSFADLPVGWHYGSGRPPTQKTITKALEVLSEMQEGGISRTEAFPGIDGEIQVCGYDGDRYLQITIEDDTFDVIFEGFGK